MRSLLAFVEARENRALGEAIADIGAKIDQDAGNLKPDLRCDPRLHGSEPKDLHGHVGGRMRNHHLDRADEPRPGANCGRYDEDNQPRQQKEAPAISRTRGLNALIARRGVRRLCNVEHGPNLRSIREAELAKYTLRGKRALT